MLPREHGRRSSDAQSHTSISIATKPIASDPSTTSCSSSVSSSESSSEQRVMKRGGYLEWESFFMASALLAAERSKDPCRQVGAIIVNGDKRIVASGYNGMPTGCSDNDIPWGKDSEDPRENKYAYVCHAEMNAVLNKCEASVRNCTLYTTLFPCNECAKILIQSRISEVVYYERRGGWQEDVSIRLFDTVGIKYRKYEPTGQRINLSL